MGDHVGGFTSPTAIEQERWHFVVDMNRAGADMRIATAILGAGSGRHVPGYPKQRVSASTDYISYRSS